MNRGHVCRIKFKNVSKFLVNSQHITYISPTMFNDVTEILRSNFCLKLYFCPFPGKRLLCILTLLIFY